MKRKFSLLKILREELESERRGLIFLIILAVPLAVGMIVASIHFYCIQQNLREIIQMVQGREAVVLSEPFHSNSNGKPNDP